MGGMASAFFGWALEKAGGAIVGGLAQYGLGKLLSLFGASEPDVGKALKEIDKKLAEIQHDIAIMLQELAIIASRLDTLLNLVALSRDEILMQGQALAIKSPIDIINNQYENLRAFDPTQDKTAHTPKGREKAAVFALDLIEAGKYDIDQRQYELHSGIMGGPGVEGVLAGCTNLLLTKLRAGAINLKDAYLTLEYLYGELLSVQGKGLILNLEGMSWKEIHEQPNPAETSDRRVMVYPGTAAQYYKDKFTPQIEAQVDLFLHCVNRLVLSQADMRTRLTPWHGSDEELHPSFLPKEAGDIYARADFLAVCAAPNKHGYEVVGRLIGEPSNVTGDLEATATLDRNVLAHGVWAPGNVWQEGMPGRVVEPPGLPLDVVQIGGRGVNLYGPEHFPLPEEDFPSGEYLEWLHDGRTYNDCNPATQVAVLKLGLRGLPEPQPQPYELDVDCFVKRYYARFSSKHVHFAYRDRNFKESPKSEESKPYGSFLFAIRHRPMYAEPNFGTKPYPIPIFQAQGVDMSLALLELRPSNTCRLPGTVLGVKFTLRQQHMYKGYGKGSKIRGPNYSVFNDKLFFVWVFRYGLGTGKPQWTQQLLELSLNGAKDGYMHTVRQDSWTAVTTAADHPPGHPMIIGINLRVMNNTYPPAHGKVSKGTLYRLESATFTLDSLELTLLPPKK